jgi:hypothetical protein
VSVMPACDIAASSGPTLMGSSRCGSRRAQLLRQVAGRACRAVFAAVQQASCLDAAVSLVQQRGEGARPAMGRSGAPRAVKGAVELGRPRKQGHVMAANQAGIGSDTVTDAAQQQTAAETLR